MKCYIIHNIFMTFNCIAQFAPRGDFIDVTQIKVARGDECCESAGDDAV